MESMPISGEADHTASPTRIYRIGGQDALRIKVSAGDYLCVSSASGHQPCEMLVLNSASEPAAACVDTAQTPAPALLTWQLLKENSHAARALNNRFAQWNIRDEHLGQALTFAAQSLPALSIRQDAELIIIAPGASMMVDDQTPPEELTVSLRSAWEFSRNSMICRSRWQRRWRNTVLKTARPGYTK